MQTNASTSRMLSSPSATGVMGALTVGLLIATSAYAEPTLLRAGDEPGVPSSFTLDFGGEGNVASARVALTDIGFEVDPDQGSAQFVHYYQEVEPLLLPGGISTGNLTIEVVQGSSAGSYDELNGEFTTGELYAIHFEGDLSAFGLESPVILPSISKGVVTLSTDSGGRIALDWAGDGQLANPFEPDNPLAFSYTCTVRAAFSPEPIALVRLALIPDVLNLELPRRTEKELTRKLFKAVDMLDRGRERAAAKKLDSFIKKVRELSGRQIAEVDAEALMSSADAVVSMLREWREPARQ